jgi:UDP-glucose 4-epimerase
MKSEHTKEFTIFGNDYDTPDGTCIRDYTHVDEICEAIRIAIEEPSNGVEGLGHSKGRSVKEMVEIFKRVNQKILSADSAETLTVTYGPRRPGDAAVSVLKNISRYMKNLYSIEDLLRLDTGSKL